MLDTTEQDLHKVFESCGAISSVKIKHKKTGKLGNGFVNFIDPASIAEALKLNESKLNEHPMLVNRLNINRHLKSTDKLNGDKLKKVSSEDPANYFFIVFSFLFFFRIKIKRRNCWLIQNH